MKQGGLEIPKMVLERSIGGRRAELAQCGKYQNLTIFGAANRRKMLFLKIENISECLFLFFAIVPHKFWVFVPKITIPRLTQLQIYVEIHGVSA